MDAEVKVKAEQELDTPSLWRSIAESSPLPMAVLEGDGHIIRYVNPVFCRLLGKAKVDLIGNAFSSVVPSGDECLSLLDRVYQTGQPDTYTGQEDGAAHPLYWSYVIWPVLAADNGIAGVVFQVTERTLFHQRATAMNQALLISSVHQHELMEQAETLNEQLARANEDLKQFAFAASHDLQEPLRMITSYSQLLLKGHRGQLDSQAGVCVDFITKGARQMRDLLAGLLSYSAAGADSGEGTAQINLNMVFEMVKQNLKVAIEESSAVVTSEHLPEVEGQQSHFVQLFQNLIGNAIKYRGEQSPRIHVSAERHDRGWRFAVADNGMGIAPEYFERIFGVFKRLHGQAIPGTGIGLAICQRVVERYGGRIWVESQPGQGATFYFTRPMSGGNR
jgi:PAS domain S-box-containing protein